MVGILVSPLADLVYIVCFCFHQRFAQEECFVLFNLGNFSVGGSLTHQRGDTYLNDHVSNSLTRPRSLGPLVDLETVVRLFRPFTGIRQPFPRISLEYSSSTHFTVDVVNL